MSRKKSKPERVSRLVGMSKEVDYYADAVMKVMNEEYDSLKYSRADVIEKAVIAYAIDIGIPLYKPECIREGVEL
jgi:hypothetical protein